MDEQTVPGLYEEISTLRATIAQQQAQLISPLSTGAGEDAPGLMSLTQPLLYDASNGAGFNRNLVQRRNACESQDCLRQLDGKLSRNDDMLRELLSSPTHVTRTLTACPSSRVVEDHSPDTAAGKKAKQQQQLRSVQSKLSALTAIEQEPHTFREYDDHGDKDILQFSSSIYFADEGEQHVEIDIMRLGAFKSTCSVEWYTVDNSAIAGVHFVEAGATVNFDPGEIRKTVQVEIIDDERWNAICEFGVNLRNPINCELGLYLNGARVKIIDNDYFPSNKFKQEIEEDEIEEVNGLSLLWEYIKFNLGVKGVKSATIFSMFCFQFSNLYFLIMLYLQVYLVDVVLNTREDNGDKLLVPNDRLKTALICGIIYIFPLAFHRALEIKRLKMDLKGISIAYLQKNLMRRYLHYHAKSNAKVRPAALALGMLSEITEVVEAGYMRALECSKIVGKLVIVSYFVLAENSKGVVPIVVMSTIMIGYAFHIVNTMIEKSEDVATATEGILASVLEICNKYRLISDYHQRPRADRIVSKAVNKLDKAGIPLAMVKLHTAGLPAWLSTALVALFIAFESKAVLDGDLPLGTFLATIKVYQEIGEQFAEGFECLMELLSSKGALVKVTTYLNNRTDLPDLLLVSQDRRGLSQRKISRKISRHALSNNESQWQSSPTEDTFLTDHVKLAIKDVSLSYGGREQPLFLNLNMGIKQGHSFAVVGPRLSGKTSLIHLLAGVIFPDDGQIFIPTHLRPIFVTSEPIVFEALGLMKNLTFGMPKREKGSEQKVIEMLRILLRKFDAPNLLHMLEGEVAHWRAKKMKAVQLDGDEEDIDFQNQGKDSSLRNWIEPLTTTDLTIISQVRAYLVNPEVLVMLRPCIYYDEMRSQTAYRNMQEYVDNRGLGLDLKTKHRRRPRTLIYSATSMEEAHVADYIWVVKGGTVTELEDKQKQSDLTAFFDQPS
eukprot:gnl/MRDRNA2_/MRDRNA2_30933_c0_seq2.p1 gnl/MRDRNA2_/MRDRNA2_30933_c0~~gnl/MRDRNA2_/MRDRNA2_30933_c0_seq2.p1  ORF type:complete len:948 (+),score=154.35 gnl/MRDRNA2_/MRDRNA2_30933_c0_seq2:134-2977(+)